MKDTKEMKTYEALTFLFVGVPLVSFAFAMFFWVIFYPFNYYSCYKTYGGIGEVKYVLAGGCLVNINGKYYPKHLINLNKIEK